LPRFMQGPGAGPDGNGLHAGVAQDTRQLADRGGGGHHVIQNRDVLVFQWGMDTEGFADVPTQFPGVESGLGGGRPNAAAGGVIERDAVCRATTRAISSDWLKLRSR